jgi:hypothetical protein
MLFDIFLMKVDNIVPALSDGRFVMIVAFVQDNKTYLMYFNTKHQGKCKLSLAVFYFMKFCEAKRYQLDNRVNKRGFPFLNLSRNLPSHQKTNTP